MFLSYGEAGDFVGMDMARKFLQMGWTRARRYANHPDGKKYDQDGNKRPQAADAMTSDKALAAQIFYEYLQKAKSNQQYGILRKEWEKSLKN